MISGLEDELSERLSGDDKYIPGANFPTPPNESFDEQFSSISNNLMQDDSLKF